MFWTTKYTVIQTNDNIIMYVQAMIVKCSYLLSSLIRRCFTVLKPNCRLDLKYVTIVNNYRTNINKKEDWVTTGEFSTPPPPSNLVKSCWCSKCVLCMNNNNSFENGRRDRAKKGPFALYNVMNTKYTANYTGD